MFLRRRRTITIAIEQRTLTLGVIPQASSKDAPTPVATAAKPSPAHIDLANTKLKERT